MPVEFRLTGYMIIRGLDYPWCPLSGLSISLITQLQLYLRTLALLVRRKEMVLLQVEVFAIWTKFPFNHISSDNYFCSLSVARLSRLFEALLYVQYCLLYYHPVLYIAATTLGFVLYWVFPDVSFPLTISSYSCWSFLPFCNKAAWKRSKFCDLSLYRYRDKVFITPYVSPDYKKTLVKAIWYDKHFIYRIAYSILWIFTNVRLSTSGTCPFEKYY